MVGASHGSHRLEAARQAERMAFTPKKAIRVAEGTLRGKDAPIPRGSSSLMVFSLEEDFVFESSVGWRFSSLSISAL